MVDFSSLGATYRAEAEKAKHRTFAFAVILVLAHLLDIKPSEVDGMGLKVSFKDPIVLYGALSLLFGYNLSRFFSESDKGETFLPLVAGRRKIRANIRAARTFLYAQKRNPLKPLTPKVIKASARQFIGFSNVALFPYRLTAVLFVLAAIPFMFMDLKGLADLIWTQSTVIADFGKWIDKL